MESTVPDEALRPLLQAFAARQVRVEGLPLMGTRPAPIDLEPFAVWAPGATISVHTPEGIREVPPPATRFFRGKVAGYDDSMAVFSVEGDTVSGMVTVGEHRFTIGPRFRSQVPGRRQRLNEEGDVDYYVINESTPADIAEEEAERQPWVCELDKLNVDVTIPRAVQPRAESLVPVSESIGGTQQYAVTLEIETDYALYQALGSSSSNVSAYVQNIVAALATIYARDVNTNVAIAHMHVYTVDDGAVGGSPWTVTPGGTNTTSTALYQLSDYYATNYASVRRSSVVLLSGKHFSGGVAWLSSICGPDIHMSNGHYYGAYAFCSGVVPDNPTRLPNSTIISGGTGDGSTYYSSFTNGYEWVAWPLSEISHELGHNFGSPHTHCMSLTAGEQTSYGRSYVDQCYGSESGCYSGTATLPTETGTIMSYCHLRSPGQVNSRFMFGAANEASHHVLDDFLLRSGGTITGGNNVITQTNASLSAITAPSSVTANSTGNAASVSNAGYTYTWTVTNGTIAGGQGTNAITFSAGASGTVALRVAAFNTSGCGVTDTKSVTIATAVNAPANVVATGASSTSISVTWSAVSGATSYNVYRSSDGTTFAKIGSGVTATSYTDAGISPAGSAFVYMVRAVNGSESSDSNKDIGTAIGFTDPTLTAGISTIKLVHVVELRAAVAAVRALAGLTPATYTDALLATSGMVRAVDISELRSALDAARTKLGVGQITYSDSTLTTRSTTIKKAHIEELRGGV